MESVRTVELRVPQSFSTFEDRSFGGLSDVLKKRLGVGLLEVSQLALFEGWFT